MFPAMPSDVTEDSKDQAESTPAPEPAPAKLPAVQEKQLSKKVGLRI